MKKKVNLLGIVLVCTVLLFATISCKKTKEKGEMKSFDMAAAQKSIDSSRAAFTEAFNKGDSTGVANCYLADAKFMPPNTPSKEGTVAIQGEIGKYIKEGIAKLTLKSTGLWGNEDMLVEESNWTIADKDGKELDHGKSLAAYKKEGGHWKLFRDIYNSDLPCSPPPPPAPMAPATPKK